MKLTIRFRLSGITGVALIRLNSHTENSSKGIRYDPQPGKSSHSNSPTPQTIHSIIELNLINVK